MAQQHEKRYTNDFFRETYLDQHWQPRVWLGPGDPSSPNFSMGPRTRWADAIVFQPNLITIIEFKLEPDPKGIGQLDLYERMFGQTLRFQRYWDRPVKKVFVTTRIDDPIQELAVDHNIDYVVFRPEWISSWEKARFRI